MNISATRKIPEAELVTLKDAVDREPPPPRESVLKLTQGTVLVEARDAKGVVVRALKTTVSRRFSVVNVVHIDGKGFEILPEEAIKKGISKVIDVGANYVMFVACPLDLTVTATLLDPLTPGPIGPTPEVPVEADAVALSAKVK